MADNVDLAAPAGTVSADDIGGVLYQRIKLGWGADGTFNEVDDASGKRVPVIEPSKAHVGTFTFTAGGTGYTSLDVVGGAQSITSMGIASSSVIITSASLLVETGTAEAVVYRLHMFSVTPPSAAADNGTWDLPSGDRASYLGYIDLGTGADIGATLYNQVDNINKQIRLGATPSIFAYLQVIGTTIAAVDHEVTLHTIEV